MKKFERFIIYPMLFIALFFSFSGEDVQQTTAQQVYDEIIARNIKIVDDNGNTVIELFESGNFGRGRIRVENGKYNESKIEIQARGMNPFIRIEEKLYDNNRGLTEDYDYETSYYSTNLINFGYTSKNYKKGQDILEISEDNIDIYNYEEDKSIYIGKDYNGHGLINIFDKYGEDYRSYSFR